VIETPMASLVIRRVAWMIAVLFVASIISFVLLRMAPGNPAREILGPVATPQAIAQLEDQMGLNKSIPQQYGIYVSHLLRGDFGISWQDREPVSKELGQRLPATIELALYAILLSIVLAIPIGVFAASHRRFDRMSRWGAVVGLETPSFWLGLLLILVFFTKLKIAPAPFGRLDPSAQPPPHMTGLYTVGALIAGQPSTFFNALGHLILPAITLGLPLTACLSRIVRRSMADVSRQDYIRTARAKGAGENRVLFRQDPYVYMARGLEATERLTFGTAVTNVITRHFTVTASGHATLAAIHPGRVILGLGRGDSSIRTLGLKPAKVAQMRALVPEIKRLLAGDPIDYDGTEIRIPWAGAQVSLMLGGTGPNTMRLAGALTDLVTLEIGVRPEAIEWARFNITAGAREAGRDPSEIELVVLCAMWLSEEHRGRARAVPLGARLGGQPHLRGHAQQPGSRHAARAYPAWSSSGANWWPVAAACRAWMGRMTTTAGTA
jgi:peptide/nickel transport system permease protein